MKNRRVKISKIAAGIILSASMLLTGCGKVMPYNVGGEDELGNRGKTTAYVNVIDEPTEEVVVLDTADSGNEATSEGWVAPLGTYESDLPEGGASTEADGSTQNGGDAGNAGGNGNNGGTTGGTVGAAVVASAEVSNIINKMSLEEKVCQMFIVTPEALTGYGLVTAAGDASRDAFRSRPVGGLIYFDQNLEDASQTKSMLTNMQNYSKEFTGLPLFLCVDEEGGAVTRVAGKSGFNATDVGPMANIKSGNEAYEAGSTVGGYLAALGFNVDFAPDADVITNPSNTVIGNRSFGTDPDIVTQYALRYSDGLHASGVLSTFKHFPGHGGTEADSHEGYAYTDRTKDQLMSAEMKPFAAAGSGKVDFVMVAHVSVPKVLGDSTPCTLSSTMITQILKGEMRYTGIVVTDAMNMGAISNTYSSATAAVEAIKAGVDMVLMPSDFGAAVSGVIEAVKSGEIPESRIDDALTRIVTVKLGLPQ